MKIVHAASEAAPFVKTGGLGDVMQALPAALSRYRDCEVSLFLPLYGTLKQDPSIHLQKITDFTVFLGWREQYVGLFQLKSRAKKKVYFIDNEFYFCRNRIYGEGDDAERFAFYSKAVLACIAFLGLDPDIIQCNDWQTAWHPRLPARRVCAAVPPRQVRFHDSQYRIPGLGEPGFLLERSGPAGAISG